MLGGKEARALRNANCVLPSPHHQGKLAVADKMETQFALVESSGLFSVLGGNETNYLGRS